MKVMPIGMHKIGLAFLFQWYAMFIYWQFVSVSVAESVWNAVPGHSRLRGGGRLGRPDERHVQLRLA